MADPNPRRPRWSLWLPAAATLAATTLAVLALLTLNAVRQRERLALDGRVLGTANRIEHDLRDNGTANARGLLEERLADTGREIVGLVLLDTSGLVTATTGSCEPGTPTREIDLLLGRSGPRGPPDGRTTESPQHGLGRGRGRAVLRVCLAEDAGRIPAAAAWILPVALTIGLALVGLALVGGRLLERERRQDMETAAQRRLEALGRAGAGLAHQLRTPLATIKGSCQLLAEDEPGGTHARRVKAAIAETERMERLLGLLLDYARPPTPEPADVPLDDVFKRLAERYVRLEHGASSLLSVRVDREHLELILENLIDNSDRAGDYRLAIELTAHKAGTQAVIEVSDRGPGPGSDPEDLFEPYVTTSADGTGLGLPIARNLAEANRGTLRLSHRDGGGTVAMLTLPRTGGAS